LQFLPQQIEVVENRQMFRRVAKFAEGVEDIRLRLPILGLQLCAEILVERGAGHRVEQRKDFQFAFHKCLAVGRVTPCAAVSKPRRDELYESLIARKSQKNSGTRV